MFSSHQTSNLDSVLIIARDFDTADVKKVMPDLDQQVDCPTKEESDLITANRISGSVTKHCLALRLDDWMPPFS